MIKAIKDLKKNLTRIEKELNSLKVKRVLTENKNVIIKLDNKINSLIMELCKIKKAIQVLED